MEDEEYCERMPSCATYDIWHNASHMLKDYFDSISLQDLVALTEKKKGKRARRKKS